MTSWDKFVRPRSLRRASKPETTSCSKGPISVRCMRLLSFLIRVHCGRRPECHEVLSGMVWMPSCHLALACQAMVQLSETHFWLAFILSPTISLSYSFSCSRWTTFRPASSASSTPVTPSATQCPQEQCGGFCDTVTSSQLQRSSESASP